MTFGFALRGLLLAAAFLLGSSGSLAMNERAVDLELVLAVDVSGSMDREESLLQRRGYVEAFVHPAVVSAVVSGAHRGIAVTYLEWADPASHVVIVPWRLIDGEEAAKSFSRELWDSPGAEGRGTSISGALVFAAGLFDGNGFDGERRVIDISGDGPNNMGAPVATAREAVVNRGITINGLPVTLKRGGGFSGLSPEALQAYYEDCVIGGPGAFVVAARSRASLEEAIRRKLVLEIAARGAPIARMAPAAAGGRTDCLMGEHSRPAWLNEYLD
jgi:hypothetical protein